MRFYDSDMHNEDENLQEKYETNLPEFLQIDLDRYKQAQEDIQNGKEVSLMDCYYCELQSSINVCEVERIISQDHAWYLREKYLGLMREDMLQ